MSTYELRLTGAEVDYGMYLETDDTGKVISLAGRKASQVVTMPAEKATAIGLIRSLQHDYTKISEKVDSKVSIVGDNEIATALGIVP